MTGITSSLYNYQFRSGWNPIQRRAPLALSAPEVLLENIPALESLESQVARKQSLAKRYSHSLRSNAYDSITKGVGTSAFIRLQHDIHRSQQESANWQSLKQSDPTAKWMIHCHRILTTRYREQDGQLFGLGDEPEAVPGNWTLDKIKKLLLKAHQLHPRLETGLMYFDNRRFVVTGKEDKYAVSAWDDTEWLSTGGFGNVFKVWSYTKAKWIVRKIMHLVADTREIQDKRIRSFYNECCILNQLNQQGSVPGISRRVSLRSLQCGEDRLFFLHSRFARYCDLGKALLRGTFDALSPRQRFQLIGPLLHGFMVMTQARVVHNDICLNNTFVSKAHNGFALYFADFGLADRNGGGHTTYLGHLISSFLNDNARWSLEYPPQVYQLISDITDNAIPPNELVTRYEEILKQWPSSDEESK